MENQHRKIAGYRDLSETEIDLMNRVKAHAIQTGLLMGEVKAHLARQSEVAREAGQDGVEEDRINLAEPGRWFAIARTDFQTANMALVRAIAQPGGF